MYKKIETYNFCDIYKHINAGIYIAAFDGQKITKGSYLDMKPAIIRFWFRTFALGR